jgi:hypothetical protein
MSMLLGVSCSLWATTPPSRATAPDVFESFRVLDTQFTKLDTEFNDLQEGLASTTQKHAKRAWPRAAREMQRTTAQISRISYRMYSHSRRRQLRYRMFKLLHQRARLLRTRLAPIGRAPSRAVARRDSPKVQTAMLNLVLQYQAISGGYAAAHCDVGAWSCGVAKKQPRIVGYPSLGVKWMCVPRTNACKGILGPKTPLLATQPLTADTTQH